MGLISRVSSRTYRLEFSNSFRGLLKNNTMDAPDPSLDLFMNFARDLVDLIPINVQTTHPDREPKSSSNKNKPKTNQASKKSDKNNPNTQIFKAQNGNKNASLKTSRAGTGTELKQRLESRLAELTGARESKKQLKRIQKKAKRSRTLEKQKDGQTVQQQRGNQNKLDEENPMRIEKKGGDKKAEKEKNIEFSKFNFVTGNEAAASGGKIAAEDSKYSEKGKSKLEGKASHVLLKHAEGLQKRMAFLEKTNPAEAKKLKDEHAWEKALAHAEGKKVNDDVDKIKASIKSGERRTKKSKSTWKARDDGITDKKDAKQNKRSSNLKDRVDKKKARKLQSAKTRGRLV